MVIDSSRLIRRFAGCALGLALAWAAPMTAAADRPPPTDPQLADLLGEAVANNPELAAARSERDAAQQRIAPAGALEDPMLELGVINAPLDPLSLGREDMTMKMLGLSQKLPFAGKRDLRRAVATADADSMELAVQEASNKLVRDVRVALRGTGLQCGIPAHRGADTDGARATRGNRAFALRRGAGRAE